MRLAILCIVYSCTLLSACINGKQKDDSIVYLDTDMDYPKLELTLKDIAEIRYIKIGGEEEGLYINENYFDIYFDESRNQIILGKYIKEPYFIATFDNKGQFVRQIGHQGLGPGEFYHSVRLAFNEKKDILTVFNSSTKKIIQYSSSGEFLRERTFYNISGFTRIFTFEDKLVLFNLQSQYASKLDIQPFRDFGWTIRALDISTLEDIPIHDHHFQEHFIIDDATILNANEGFCLTDKGYLFTSSRSDTTYLLDYNLKIHPYLIDIKHNRERGFLLIPTFETKDFLFLHLVPPSDGKYSSEHRYYAIRRSDKAIFSCGTNSYFSLFSSNSLCLGREIQSITPGYGRCVIYKIFIPSPPNPDFPVPPEVEELAKDLDDESNPILMIIKFK
jgi:hypothetical protein